MKGESNKMPIIKLRSGTSTLITLTALTAAALSLSGCGGSGGSTSQTGNPTLDSTRAMAITAEQDQTAVANATVEDIDTQSESGTEEQMLDDSAGMTRATGQASWDHRGLHFERTWEGDTDTNTFKRTLTVTGTSFEGVTVNLTRTVIWDRNTDTRTMTLIGTIAKSGNTYDLNISRERSVSGDIRTLTINSTILKNSAEIYAKNITRTINISDPTPRQRTQNGTLTVHNASDPAKFVKLTYTDLLYTPDTTNHYRIYNGGTADLLNEAGDTAHLTVQDGVLTGPLMDPQSQQIGTITIGHGTVTITK